MTDQITVDTGEPIINMDSLQKDIEGIKKDREELMKKLQELTDSLKSSIDLNAQMMSGRMTPTVAQAPLQKPDPYKGMTPEQIEEAVIGRFAEDLYKKYVEKIKGGGQRWPF